MALKAQSVEHTSLEECANRYPTDKMKAISHDYIPTYEALLAPIRHSSRNVVEIGIGGPGHLDYVRLWTRRAQLGNSLRMWRDYFPKATIVGIDIDPEALLPRDSEERIITVQADQSDGQQLNNAIDCAFAYAKRESESRSGFERSNDKVLLDVVIDDGSHELEHQVASFVHLIDRLGPRAIYVIEDVQPRSYDDLTTLAAFPEPIRSRIVREFDIRIIDKRSVTLIPDDVMLVLKKKPQPVR